MVRDRLSELYSKNSDSARTSFGKELENTYLIIASFLSSDQQLGSKSFRSKQFNKIKLLKMCHRVY